MVNVFPLEAWRKAISYHPWHFWGWANINQVPLSSQCNGLVQEYAWQYADAAGRNEIRDSIKDAEDLLRQYLGYSIGPRWIEETVQYPRPMAYGQQFGASIGGDGRWLSIRANEGYIRACGVEAYTLIDSSAAVVYSDEDGDGLNETFTVTVDASTAASLLIESATGDCDPLDGCLLLEDANGTEFAVDPDQIGVYFASGDRLDSEDVSERWRIAPVKVTLEGDNIVIRGRAWMMARPILYEGINTRSGIDPADSDNYVSTVAVYRHYTDPTGTTNETCQALLIWETEPYPGWAFGCGDDSVTYTTNSRDPAALAYGIARAEIRDARLGEIAVGRAVYDSDNDEWIGASWGTCRQPDRVILRYEAGARVAALQNVDNLPLIDGAWDKVIARLAAAELNQRICACDTANRELYRWQHDLGLDGNAKLSTTDQDNPLGTRAGAIYAWRRIQHLKLTEAFILR